MSNASHLPLSIAFVSIVLLLSTGCGPEPEDLVADLSRGGAVAQNARQELLLARERAVDPLVKALDQLPSTETRIEIASVLSSLMMRTEDVRVEAALVRLLAQDPEPSVRAAVAHDLGLQRRASSIPELLLATADTAGAVRRAALEALAELSGKWDADTTRVQERVRHLSRDPHAGTRVEAMVILSRLVHTRLQAARQATLTGDLARAESLLVAITDFAPGEKRAAYDLGLSGQWRPAQRTAGATGPRYAVGCAAAGRVARGRRAARTSLAVSRSRGFDVSGEPPAFRSVALRSANRSVCRLAS